MSKSEHAITYLPFDRPILHFGSPEIAYTPADKPEESVADGE